MKFLYENQIRLVMNQLEQAVSELPQSDRQLGNNILLGARTERFQRDLDQNFQMGLDGFVDDQVWIGMKSLSSEYDFSLSLNDAGTELNVELYPVSEKGETNTERAIVAFTAKVDKDLAATAGHSPR